MQQTVKQRDLHVLRYGEGDAAAIDRLAARYGLQVKKIEEDSAIPGS